MAASGRVPRARLPPDRDLRRLRATARGRAALRASTRRATTRARSGSPDRSRRGLFAYLEDGTPTKPIHPAWAAHGALLAARLARHGADGPPIGARGEVRPLPRLPRSGEGRDRHRGASSPTSARAGRRRGSPTSRSPPATSCTARSGRPRRRCRTDLDPTRSTTSWSRCPAAGVSLVLEPAEHEGRAALGVRGQVLAPVLDRGDARARPRRRLDVPDEAIADPRRARRSRARCGTRRRTTRRTRRRSPAASAIRLRGRHGARGGLPVPAGRARESALAGRGAREVPRERRRSPSPTTPLERSRRRSSPSRSRTTCRGGTLAADACGKLRPYDVSGPRPSSRRSSPPSASFVERDVVPVASELEHADEYPAELVETMRRDGAVRDDDPRGVRRTRARARHVRADRDRALARAG